MRLKTAIATYLILGLISLGLGWVYTTSDQFLSYHSQAVGASWQEVDSATQTLILALMKVAGGGWLALGFFTIVFGIGAVTTSSILARWALPIGTIIFWLVSFVATWSVYRETGAPTPWAPSLVAIVLALVALLIDSPWHKTSPEQDISGSKDSKPVSNQ